MRFGMRYKIYADTRKIMRLKIQMQAIEHYYRKCVSSWNLVIVVKCVAKCRFPENGGRRKNTSGFHNALSTNTWFAYFVWTSIIFHKYDIYKDWDRISSMQKSKQLKLYHKMVYKRIWYNDLVLVYFMRSSEESGLNCKQNNDEHLYKRFECDDIK